MLFIHRNIKLFNEWKLSFILYTFKMKYLTKRLKKGEKKELIILEKHVKNIKWFNVLNVNNKY